MFLWLKRLFKLLLYSALVFITVITLTSSLLGTALSGLLGATAASSKAVPVSPLQSELDAERAKNQLLQSSINKHKESVRKMGQQLVARSRKIAAVTLAELPAGSIPIAGVAVLVAGALWELKQLCQGLYDVESLYADVELDEPVGEDALNSVCHPSLPSLGQTDERKAD